MPIFRPEMNDRTLLIVGVGLGVVVPLIAALFVLSSALW
jgi:hypothetical protein